MQASVNKKIIAVAGIIGVLALLDIFYFRFHTYFQTSKIDEKSPIVTDMNGRENAFDMRESLTSKTLRAGNFMGVDFIHKGSGSASLIENPDGTRYLRFENFQVTNGPDLYVYLSNGPAPTNDIKSLDSYVSLGRLKGNKGNQNYEIPAGTPDYTTVVIWCRQFSALFSYAVLR